MEIEVTKLESTDSSYRYYISSRSTNNIELRYYVDVNGAISEGGGHSHYSSNVLGLAVGNLFPGSGGSGGGSSGISEHILKVKKSQKIRLHPGDQLDIVEYKDPDGKLVKYFMKIYQLDCNGDRVTSR